MKDPIIVIDMEGGVIQRIRTTEPVRVIVLDLDVEGVDPAYVCVIEGHKSVVTAAFDTELLPNMVQKVVDEVDAPPPPLTVEALWDAQLENYPASVRVTVAEMLTWAGRDASRLARIAQALQYEPHVWYRTTPKGRPDSYIGCRYGLTPWAHLNGYLE